MLNKRVHDKCEKLLDKLYGECTYNEFAAAFDVAVRAYQRISKNDPIFYHNNFYLGVISCEDRLISAVCNYYLDGNGQKENLKEDIFPMINILSGNKDSILAKELKNLFLSVYDN
ncbi:hypothetical protein [Clostridium sp. JN-1]|jgi:hypothetical protein|uniref:hypothetical protein n=1 Tax=Clostridium sp. JN-1 TaxID=2483110 RepID=UPI000F0B7B51|nr:hypothetical protein [Clostridium sp. JN-1]